MKKRDIWLISVDGFVTCNITRGGIDKALKVLKLVCREEYCSHVVCLHRMGDDGFPHIVARMEGSRFVWED